MQRLELRCEFTLLLDVRRVGAILQTHHRPDLRLELMLPHFVRSHITRVLRVLTLQTQTILRRLGLRKLELRLKLSAATHRASVQRLNLRQLLCELLQLRPRRKLIIAEVLLLISEIFILRKQAIDLRVKITRLR